MEKSLLDYDQSLEALEKQREELELVMQRMGKEWEESGPGIGWLGALKLSSRDPSPPAGPSPEYLGSLLNVNEELLAESLANTSTLPDERQQKPQKQQDALCGCPLPLATPGNDTGNGEALVPQNSFAQPTGHVVSPPMTPDELLLNRTMDQSLRP